MKAWEIHGTKYNEVKNYDVGIVLGGMFEYNNDLNRLRVMSHADRIWHAITLYKKGKIKKILISGDSGYVLDHGLKEAIQLKEALVEWGIPTNDIITETISKNTHENALETKNVLENSYPHLKNFLLITSGFHMRRANACFEKEGLKCDVFATDLMTGPNSSYHWDQYIVPNMGIFFGWNKLIKEWIGFITYDLVGYI
ncbi:MAG: YdcF family protein [Crocinitomicaceae bacterium]